MMCKKRVMLQVHVPIETHVDLGVTNHSAISRYQVYVTKQIAMMLPKVTKLTIMCKSMLK